MMWLNGDLVENGGRGAALDAASAGTTLGWGVFTTLGVRAGNPRFLRRHFERLKRDAGEAELDFDLDFTATARAVEAVLDANSLQNGLLRLTLTARGDGRWNAASGADFSVLSVENAPLPRDDARQIGAGAPPHAPLRVAVSPYRVEAKRALCGVKTTAYLPYFWAWREAKKRGFDEAILRDGDGFLSESARATLFWVRENIVFTPSLETGCLRGIGRDLLLEWAAQNHFELHQGRFEIGEAEKAAEIWLVSAATGPRRVTYWQDESGDATPDAGNNSLSTDAVGADFARWFEKQTE